MALCCAVGGVARQAGDDQGAVFIVATCQANVAYLKRAERPLWHGDVINCAACQGAVLLHPLANTTVLTTHDFFAWGIGRE